jgi:molecular chaperone DnaJ
MAKDYYQILGVPENASEADIKRAYRELAKKYHPDRNSGNSDAENRFKEIGEAYSVLSDKQKREQYDTIRRYGGSYDPRTAGQPGGGGFGGRGFNPGDIFGGGGCGVGDIFEQFFGGAARGRARSTRRAGEDITLTIGVDFLTVARGGKVKLRVPASGVCPVCKGSGGKPGTSYQTCDECGGSGRVTRSQGGFALSQTCTHCLGRGVIPAQTCPACYGTGRAQGDTTIAVTVPSGISEDQKIRIPGRGEPGTNGGAPGDLYVRVRANPHPRFRREGVDVYTEEEIPLTAAILGGEVCTLTIHGEVCAKVPPGTQPGTKLRLKRKGIHAEKSGRIGDHFIVLKVVIPKKLTKKQRELIEEFGKAGG